MVYLTALVTIVITHLLGNTIATATGSSTSCTSSTTESATSTSPSTLIVSTSPHPRSIDLGNKLSLPQSLCDNGRRLVGYLSQFYDLRMSRFHPWQFRKVPLAFNTPAISASSNSVAFTNSIQSFAFKIVVIFVRHGPNEWESVKLIRFMSLESRKPNALIPLEPDIFVRQHKTRVLTLSTYPTQYSTAHHSTSASLTQTQSTFTIARNRAKHGRNSFHKSQ